MNRNASIAALYTFNFLKSLQFFGALAVPFYLIRVGTNYTGMFALEAIFSVCIILFEIPTGIVADRFGRKASLFLGSLGFGCGFLIFGFTVSLPLLVIAEIVCAFGMSLMSGADRALIYEVAKSSGLESDAAKINARYDAFGTAGMFIAFPAGTLFAGAGLVTYKAALGLVFVATGIMILLAGFVILGVQEPSREKLRGSSLRAGIEGFRFIFHHPPLRRFSLNYALISSLTFFMFWFYQSLLIKNSFPVSFQGFVPAAFNFGAMLLLLTTGFFQKQVGTRRTLFLSSLIPGILYLGVFFLPGLPMALVSIFGITMLKMFRAPILTTLMNERIGDTNRATVLSGVSMLERVMTAALYPVAGILTDISLEWTFLAMGAITVFVSLFLQVQDRHFEE